MVKKMNDWLKIPNNVKKGYCMVKPPWVGVASWKAGRRTIGVRRGGPREPSFVSRCFWVSASVGMFSTCHLR